MFKVLSLLIALLTLTACNEIDGKITVYADFMLVDEDGRHIMITTGIHMAEFEYKPQKREIEIEIKDIDNGKDRDFEFEVPDLSSEDFHKERLELHFPATAGDREMDTKMLITNKVLSKGDLRANFYRCREHGSAVYDYRPVVFRMIKRVTHIAAHIDDGENTLALFEGSKVSKEREKLWIGQCGDELPENLEDVVPN